MCLKIRSVPPEPEVFCDDQRRFKRKCMLINEREKTFPFEMPGQVFLFRLSGRRDEYRRRFRADEVHNGTVSRSADH